MTRCVFVTGSGTDVGKTYVAAGLIRALRRAGLAVGAMKPVMSGFDPAHADPAHPDGAGSDAAVLLDALGGSGTIEAMSPWRFAAPLSPDRAAALEGRTIAFDALVECCRRGVTGDIVLVEGVGGVMVPLDDCHTVLDWMAALDWPVMIVCGSYLGAISHALTAVTAVRQRGLRVTSLVVNESVACVGAEETARALRRFVGAPVHCLARNAGEVAFDDLASAFVR